MRARAAGLLAGPAPAPTAEPRPEPEPPRWSACYAPHSTMYFDQFGKVRACCQNTGVYLGDVTVQSLREIWESADAERMRTALEHDRYDAGCEFCEWQVREGNDEILFAAQFDRLRPAERRPTWPRRLEFSLTNTCNLQCVMCNGDWSSTIRAKREHRPPIEPVYGEPFYAQLAEFLPHAEEIEFLGGEPFLGKEPLRVMEMLAELPDPPKVTITTNATIYTDRVRRILDLLKPSIVVSLDGASEATYDAIRVGAHLPTVLANLDRFREVVGHEFVSLAHCLMTRNWHEFADLLQLAEDRDLYVGVNVVRFPEEHSLYQLPPEDLQRVVDALQATTVELTGSRRRAWEGHVAALAHRLDVVSEVHVELGPRHGLPGAPEGPPVDVPRTMPDPILDRRTEWLPFDPIGAGPVDGAAPLLPGERPVVRFVTDVDGTLSILERHADASLPIETTDLDGEHISVLEDRLKDALGPGTIWEWRAGPAGETDVRRLRTTSSAAGLVSFTTAARRDDAGVLTGAMCHLCVADEAAGD